MGQLGQKIGDRFWINELGHWTIKILSFDCYIDHHFQCKMYVYFVSILALQQYDNQKLPTHGL